MKSWQKVLIAFGGLAAAFIGLFSLAKAAKPTEPGPQSSAEIPLVFVHPRCESLNLDAALRLPVDLHISPRAGWLYYNIGVFIKNISTVEIPNSMEVAVVDTAGEVVRWHLCNPTVTGKTTILPGETSLVMACVGTPPLGTGTYHVRTGRYEVTEETVWSRQTVHVTE